MIWIPKESTHQGCTSSLGTTPTPVTHSRPLNTTPFCGPSLSLSLVQNFQFSTNNVYPTRNCPNPKKFHKKILQKRELFLPPKFTVLFPQALKKRNQRENVRLQIYLYHRQREREREREVKACFVGHYSFIAIQETTRNTKKPKPRRGFLFS